MFLSVFVCCVLQVNLTTLKEFRNLLLTIINSIQFRKMLFSLSHVDFQFNSFLGASSNQCDVGRIIPVFCVSFTYSPLIILLLYQSFVCLFTQSPSRYVTFSIVHCSECSQPSWFADATDVYEVWLLNNETTRAERNGGGERTQHWVARSAYYLSMKIRFSRCKSIFSVDVGNKRVFVSCR